MLSLIILTRNEEKSISRAIKSITCADEILVIDDDSTDKTIEIAKSLGARIIPHKLEGNFSQQRNFAMEQAKGDWVLFLDADEELSPELNEEIGNILTNQARSKYFLLKRKDFFWGKPVTHGEVLDAYSKGIIRLVSRNAGQWENAIHEVFKPNSGSLGLTLKGYIHHYPHQSIKDFLKHVNKYSTIRAEELFKNGRKTNWFEILVYPKGKFLYTYFIRGGFKDGVRGFIYSFMMSLHSFLVRSKLYMAHSDK